MAKRPPSENGSRPAPRSRRSPTYAGERLPRELFADEEVSKDHERRKHAPLRAEDQRERVELASLAKLNSEGESAVAIGNDAAALVVEGGKHKGEEVAFGQDGATLGRSSKCTLTLRMGAGVSRHHAQIVFVASKGAFTIEDLGSRNGTNVNGATIAGPTFLRDRDLIEISAERIRYIGPSPREAPEPEGINAGDAMPAPGFSLDDPVPHSQMADVTAPSMAPAEVLRAAKGARTAAPPDLPPPPVAMPPSIPVDDDLPPPLSPAPSPPLAAPRSPPPVPPQPAESFDMVPPSVGEPSAPGPTAPLPQQYLPEPLPPEPGSLPPALPHADSDINAGPAPKKGGGSSFLLFALGIFLGVLMIGAAFGIDAFVLDGMVAKTVLNAVGMGAGDDKPQQPLIPDGPSVDVASRGGGEVKSVRVVVGDRIKVADVLGTIARGGPEDPAKHQKLLAEKARLTRLTKSKRKKTRKIAKAKLAKVTAAIAKGEQGPVKIYNIRSDVDGVVKEIKINVGDKLSAGDVVIRVVKPSTAAEGTTVPAAGSDGEAPEKAKQPAPVDAAEKN